MYGRHTNVSERLNTKQNQHTSLRKLTLIAKAQSGWAWQWVDRWDQSTDYVCGTGGREGKETFFLSFFLLFFLTPSQPWRLHQREKQRQVYIVQELCESRRGRSGLSVLTNLLVSVDVKNYWTMLRLWSQLVPNMSTTSEDIKHHFIIIRQANRVTLK